MRLELHSAARRELHLAIDWYLVEANKVTAARFIDEFEQLTTLIRDNPNLGKPEEAGARRFVFRRFPYTLVYRILADRIEILAVAHQSRRPEYWTSRL